MSLTAQKHWLVLRLTALAAIPLCVWLVLNIIGLVGADYTIFMFWLKEPVNAVLMILFVLITFSHAALGIHEILEDYVHNKNALCASMLAKKIFFLAVGALCIYSIVAVNLKPIPNPPSKVLTGVVRNVDGPVR